MIHRHLHAEGNHWSVAVIDSIWERGDDKDVLQLLRTLYADPLGPAAEAVLRAAPHSSVYGYPKMFVMALERWRGREKE